MGGATVHLAPVDRFLGITGTPVDNQIAVFTGANGIEGDANFTWDGSTFNVTGAITATSYGGIVEANLIDKTATELISGLFIFTGLAPGMVWNETDAALDEKNWQVNASTGALGLQLVDDVFGSATPVFTVQRTAMVVDSFDFSTAITATSYDGVLAAELGNVRKVGTPADGEMAVWTGDGTVEGNSQWDIDGELSIISVDTNTLNNVGLRFFDPDVSGFGADGWEFKPGQAGLFQGDLILTDEPSDAVNNRAITFVYQGKPVFGKGIAVADNFSVASETSGALAYYMPWDTTGREEAKISARGFDPGFADEALLSIETYNYQPGLTFTRHTQFVTEGDGRILINCYGSIHAGHLTGAAQSAVEAGDNAAMGFTLANGLELTGQGSTNDLVFFNDNHAKILSVPSGSGKLRLHYRFADTRYMEMEMNNTNWQMVGVNNVNDFLITGIGGEFNVDSHITSQGTVTSVGRIKGTTRVTTTYTILVTDEIVVGNTDGGAFTATLPAGAQGRTFRVINSGSTGLDLTLAPNGAEDLIGANTNFTLHDGESIEITYDTTDGWY